MATEYKRPTGYRWRSSKFLIIACVAIALFTENYMFTFIVPILDFMLEDRLNVDPSDAQYITSAVLSVHALVCVIVGPATGHLADKIPSRKGSLLVSLAFELVGTIIVAAATSVSVLICGRIILAIGGNAAWIIGLATVADTVGSDNTAKTLGAVSTVYTSGLLIGPMVSGWILPLFGYWPTWSTAILVLVIDMLMRLVIVEAPKETKDNSEADSRVLSTDGRDYESSGDVEATGAETSPNSADETTPLLQSPSQDYHISETESHTTDLEHTQVESPPNFYRIVLAHPRALTAMLCHMASALVVTSLDTTLPIHVIREFGWNTAQTSFMFFLVQIPQLILGSFTGWLKDIYGTKILTGLGYLVTGFLLWLLGTPGKDGLSFIGSGHKGQVIYSSTLLALGFARSLTIGTGVLEITSVIREIQEANPGIFGPNGGYSRAYSLTNLSWNFGLLVGPLLSGSLAETVGYYYMNFTFGMSI
ncbi:hypothetical protein UA08_06326 [Talaromyces atroroseus]|uniref:Major facilitator superfamily (MFS) profile domain-containing protein n=1 Tax=Talaromyces atroroseus TaxID=1441469 RepID=A0A225AC12_TALAT|nr:hypothetical protein UA08_06326 [Talaromyces atroroseus]OKL58641.1 hypothetical protein UA08_06326 [Talaromyces atroroseus]